MENYLSPEITVVIAVYNGEKFLKQTLDSILNQTFENFELVIINDGSSDKTHEIITSFQDRRLRYIINEKNLGTVESLNTGLSVAKGEFIARIDGDDIAHPTRLEKQYQFLKANADISIVGCHINFINEQNEVIGKHFFPLSDREVKATIPFETPMGGPCVMFNKSRFSEHNLLYVQEFLYAEDYDLWQRALMKLNGANYDEILVDYRISTSQVSNKHYAKQQIADRKIKANALKAFQLEEKTMYFLDLFFQDNIELAQAENFESILKSLSILFAANEKLSIYDGDLIKRSAARKLERILIFYTSKKYRLFKYYRQSELYVYHQLSLTDRLKSYFKQILN